MFIVLKSYEKPNPPKNPNLLEWYHEARKRYETVEITQMSRRSLDDIKKEYPEAFEEVFTGPEKYKGLSITKPIIDAPEKEVPVKATEPNKYKCSDCMLGSASLGGIRRHITKMHGKGEADVIDIATNLPVKEDGEEEVTETVIELTKPTIISVPDDEEVKVPIVEAPMLKCPKCDFSTDNEGGLKRHITRMHKDDSESVPVIEVKTEPVAPVEPEVTFVRPTAKRRDF